MTRKDDPVGVMKFAGKYEDGVALIVLGGTSGRHWKSLQSEIRPNVILGANGTCFEIKDLDFHLVVENMHMAAGRAAKGEKRYQRIMGILNHEHNAKVKMISYLSWDLLEDKTNCISIKRMGELGDNYEEQFARFSFRKYGDGFLAGPLFSHPGALTSSRIKFRIGTVATQLLHLAGILGVKEVHTIGMDFAFKDQKHHWYEYTNYQPDKFRTSKMFCDYHGLATQHDWMAGAAWLKETIEPLMERDGLKWIDHSNGLLKAVGFRGAM